MAEPTATLRLKSSNTSIRSRIHNLVLENPYVSTSEICKELELSYKKYKRYVRKEKCVAKRYTVTGNAHETHRNKYVWNIPQWRKYREQLEETAFHFGWNYSPRNKLWFYNYDGLGSILWHNTNRIELFIRGKTTLAKAKQLFNYGFFANHLVKDYQEIDQVFNQGAIETKHHTFNIGHKLPRFQIDYFTGSHGITIYTDGSHPKQVEVAETKPFWLEELHHIQNNFKTDMKQHMKLLANLNRISEKQIEITEQLQKPLQKPHGLATRIRSFLKW